MATLGKPRNLHKSKRTLNRKNIYPRWPPEHIWKINFLSNYLDV